MSQDPYISRRFISLSLGNKTASEAFISQYPIYQYKYRVKLKRQLAFFNPDFNTGSEEPTDSDDSDFLSTLPK